MSSSSASDGRGAGRPRALDAVDPILLGQLIARHGAPRQAPPLTWEEQERRLLIARRERALAAADLGLIDHVERHRREAGGLSQLPERDPLPPRAPIARFDLDAWPIRRPGGEERELEPSEELRRAMSHRTPQAFLRDLHRPVQSFGSVQLRRVPSPTSSGVALAQMKTAITAAMSHSSRDDAVQPLATRLMEDGMRELRAILARPWADSRPTSPLPLRGMVPGIEDSMWFGVSGGYDPDV